jgi:hypothetical protein
MQEVSGSIPLTSTKEQKWGQVQFSEAVRGTRKADLTPILLSKESPLDPIV